jgi:cell division protein FtsI/penicillin-binding protein 2
MRGWGKKRRQNEIHPDEIFIDSANVADFDRDRFEGRIERPLSRRSLYAAGSLVTVILLLLVFRAGDLQIAQGATFAQRAQDNQLSQTILFADRGIITDRNGTPLAWN